jgi:hypothetical protein
VSIYCYVDLFSDIKLLSFKHVRMSVKSPLPNQCRELCTLNCLSKENHILNSLNITNHYSRLRDDQVICNINYNSFILLENRVEVLESQNQELKDKIECQGMEISDLRNAKIRLEKTIERNSEAISELFEIIRAKSPVSGRALEVATLSRDRIS